MNYNIHRAYGGFAAELANLCAITDTTIEEYEIYCYPQTWPNTSLGFGGIAGQAISSSLTFVAINPWDTTHYALVVVAGIPAYVIVNPTETFLNFVRDRRTPGRADAGPELGEHVIKFKTNGTGGWWDLKKQLAAIKDAADECAT